MAQSENFHLSKPEELIFGFSEGRWFGRWKPEERIFDERRFGLMEKEAIPMKIDSWRDLDVYQSAFALQQSIFNLSKAWPKEERYSLTDQIRRSSRSVGANICEAWAKRRYSAHFLSKLTDSDGELQESLHWLESAQACGYLSADDFKKQIELATQIGRQLGAMMNRYESFCF